MKIILFGSIVAGKTTIAKEILQMYPEFEYVSIDESRINYGDGTMEKEKLAQNEFLSVICENKKQIIEASGLGELGDAIFKNMSTTTEPVLIVILYVENATIEKRLEKRMWNIPFPGNQDNLDQIICSINFGVKYGKIQMTWAERTNTHILNITNEDYKSKLFVLNIIDNFLKLYLYDTE